jgi:hypothetical protein
MVTMEAAAVSRGAVDAVQYLLCPVSVLMCVRRALLGKPCSVEGAIASESQTRIVVSSEPVGIWRAATHTQHPRIREHTDMQKRQQRGFRTSVPEKRKLASSARHVTPSSCPTCWPTDSNVNAFHTWIT